MSLAAATPLEILVAAFVAIIIAALGVLTTVRTTRIKSETDQKLNVLTVDAKAASIKVDSTERLIDQLQEQLNNAAKAEIEIRRELLECNKRETSLIVELAQTKAQSIIAQAEAKANHNAVETRVDRIEQLFTRVLRSGDEGSSPRPSTEPTVGA